MRKLSVIIINYNTNKQLTDCLASLPNYAEVITVDNHSKEKPTLSKGKVILNDKNLGFAKAVNIGLSHSNGEYILLLNPDTKITPGSIDAMLSFYETHKEAGIIAPALYKMNGEIQKSVRKFPSIIGAIKEYILKQKGSYDFYLPAGRQACQVDVVVGACLLIKKDLLISLGGLSEKFFLYYEDIDLCKRVKNKGLKVYFLPDVSVYHEIGASSNRESYNLLVQSSKMYHGLVANILIQLIIRIGQKLK